MLTSRPICFALKLFDQFRPVLRSKQNHPIYPFLRQVAAKVDFNLIPAASCSRWMTYLP